MNASTHPPVIRFMARLAASLPFLITAVIAGVVLGAAGEAFLAVRAGYWIALIVAVLAGFTASHFAYGQLEIHLAMAISIAWPAMFAPKPLWFAIPGAVTGFMAAIAIVDVMDRPNREKAEMEWKNKHDQKKHDAA